MNNTANYEEDVGVARLKWGDYGVLALTFGVSTMIGVYYAWRRRRSDGTTTAEDEFIRAGKNMGVLPVSWSLLATVVSGLNFVVLPAEVYVEDMSYWLWALPTVPSTFFAYYFILPIFNELDMPSMHQYLEFRFDRSIRVMASWFSIVALLFYLPIVVYIPSVMLQQATGIDMYVVSIGLIIICSFYTMIGGIKSVIWTDFFQFSMMIVTTVIIIIIGTIEAGGFYSVIKTAYDDRKFNIFNFSPNPLIKYTFWTVFIGGFTINLASLGLSQSFTQRLLSLPTRKDQLKSLLVYMVGAILSLTACLYFGLIIYKSYYGCDPIDQKIVYKAEQMMPHFIMDKFGYIPVLPGLFVAGICSASLSTLSTFLNTAAGLIYEDNFRKWNLSEKRSSLIVKIIIIIVGAYCVAGLFLVERMGSIISVIFIVTSISSAPFVTVYMLGMFVPIANKKGAIFGALGSAALLLWIATGATFSKVNVVSKKIYPVNTCSVEKVIDTSFNVTATIPHEDDTFPLYRLSYLLYVPLGTLVGVIIGIIVSYVSGPTNLMTLDRRLISPLVRKFLPLKSQRNRRIEGMNIKLEEKLMENAQEEK